MEKLRIRFGQSDEDSAVRLTDKEPPFSDEMRHDSKIRFDTNRFREEDLQGIMKPKGKVSGDAGSNGKVRGRGKSGANGKAGAAGRAGANGKAEATGKAGANGKAEATGKAGANGRVEATGKAGATGKTRITGRAGKAVLGTVRKGAAAASGLHRMSNEDLQREEKENPGPRAISEGKTAVVRTKRVITTGVRTTKGAVKYARYAKKTADTAVKTSRAVSTISRTVAKLAQQAASVAGKAVSNPYVLLAVAIILLVIAIILVIMQINTFFQSTPKNLMGDELYDEIQAYLFEKDAAVILEFEEYEDNYGGDYDKIRKVQEIYPATSIGLMSAYLVAKYQGGLTLELAKMEIDEIHGQLYYIEDDITVNSDDEIILTVTLKGQTLQQYFDTNIDDMLTQSQKQSYDWLLYVSEINLASGAFGHPFADGNWRSHTTDEYGERTSPTTGVHEFHTGLDIAYPAGTPILNVIGGTVVEAKASGGDYGLTVVVESADGRYKVRYAHMSKILVMKGDSVQKGENVGLVGNTGYSTGPHLHIEIFDNGVRKNPREYLPM